MLAKNEKIESLKIKLNIASKHKILNEREAYKFRSLHRSLSEDLDVTKNEIEHLKGLLEEMKDQMSLAHHQISMIEICKSSEKVKIEAHVHGLYTHQRGFNNLFDKEKEKVDLHNKELREKKLEEQEQMMQKQLQLEQKNKEQLQEAMTVEAECEALERECAVLKKRNAAIMLKLRRKLVETEDARRELLKKKTAITSSEDSVDKKNERLAT